MMNIVVPMAGKGTRFKKDYKEPKPLIDVNGKPMVKAAVDCIIPLKGEYRLIFIVDLEMDYKWKIADKLHEWYPGCLIVFVDRDTEGALCSVLTAVWTINNNDELLVANCDQLINFPIDDFYYICRHEGKDGMILTYKSQSPNHSFAKVDNFGNVVSVAEKIVISNHATVGLYWFRHGKEFVSAAAEKISRNDREANGEFYVCPVYEYYIANMQTVGYYENNAVNLIGSSKKLKEYLNDNTGTMR